MGLLLDATGFMVDNWTFGSTPGITHYSDHTYTLRLSHEWYGAFEGMVPANSPPTYGDMNSSTGKAGQNSSTPSEKYFGSHYILQLSSLIAGTTGPCFDPSYGLTYTSPTNFEGNAVAGYGKFEANYYSGSTPVYTDFGARKVGGTVNICFAVGTVPGSYGPCSIF